MNKENILKDTFAHAGTADAWLRDRGIGSASPLGSTNIPVSPAGFGCYRVDDGNPVHREAMEKALLAGINLLDTSSNYADGASERLVGSVIGDLASKGSLDRRAVVVVSKVGYLQGTNLRIADQRAEEGNPFPELVPYGQGIQHCIHPEFLEDQLTRSLDRLGMECLDVYLLHNPEYYLSWAESQRMPPTEARAEFNRRVETAFAWMEEQVAKGRIQYYGISSNTFPARSVQADFVSVSKVWEAAERVSPNHHFRVVEFPMNLYEPGAATERNQPGGGTLLDFAREKNLGVLINRPLNALRGDWIQRLADVQAGEPLPEAEIENRLRELIESEKQFRTGLLKKAPMPRSIRQQLRDFIDAGEPLLEKWRDFKSLEQWRDVQSQWLLPRVNGVLHYLVNMKYTTPEINQWVTNHVDTVNRALDGVTSAYARPAAEKALKIKAAAQRVDPRWAGADTLSQTALRALRSTTGISCVLVGMRRPEYVEDVLAELARPVEKDGGDEAWRKVVRELLT